MIKRRNLFLCILFSIITCGIYVIYWYIVLTNDTNKLAQSKTASGGLAFLFTLITCGIYGIYWHYKLGKKVGEIEGGGSHGVLYLILCLICFGWINFLLAQSALNEASRRMQAAQMQQPVGQ